MDFFEQTFDTPAKRLGFLVSDRGLKQREVAKVVGKSAPFISTVISGDKNFVPEDWVKVAEYFGVTVDWLLCRANAPMYWTEDSKTQPNYLSEQADKAANLIDSMPPRKRDEMLAVLQVMALNVEKATLDSEDVAQQLGVLLQLHRSPSGAVTVERIKSILLSFALGFGVGDTPE